MLLSDVCLSDVCLTSVAYIGPNSRTERPRKTKIGTELAHITRGLPQTLLVHYFQGQKVKGQRCFLFIDLSCVSLGAEV